MRSSITHIFIMLILALICTNVAFASGTEKQIEEKASESKADSSVAERAEANRENSENADAKHGSGTERDSTVKTANDKEAESLGSTSEHKAPSRHPGSGTERE